MITKGIDQRLFATVAAKLAGKPIGKLMPYIVTRVHGGKCAWCEQQIVGFDNELSLKEFGISGLCNDCQNATFGVTSDD